MSVHDEVLNSVEAMRKRFGDIGKDLLLPPPSMLNLKLEFTDIEEGVSLKAKMPFQKDMINPLRLMQGGFIAAGIDDVMGPLSFMAASMPVVTLQLSVNYFRPFVESDGWVEIEARVVNKTRTILYMEAEVKNPKGQVVCRANSQSMVVSRDK